MNGLLQFIFDTIYGLKGDFCLVVFLVAAFLLGVGISRSPRPVDPNKDNA